MLLLVGSARARIVSCKPIATPHLTILLIDIIIYLPVSQVTLYMFIRLCAPTFMHFIENTVEFC